VRVTKKVSIALLFWDLVLRLVGHIKESQIIFFLVNIQFGFLLFPQHKTLASCSHAQNAPTLVNLRKCKTMCKLSYAALVKWHTVVFFIIYLLFLNYFIYFILKLFYLLYSKLFVYFILNYLFSKLFVHFILNYLFAIF